MNPLSINSTTGTTTQFGFKATFDFFNALLTIDVTDLTVGTYTDIAFSVLDGYGNEINLNAPLSGATKSIEIDLPSGDHKYAQYKIVGTLTDTDAKVYNIEVEKELCKPANSNDDVVKGKFEHTADCKAPLMTIKDATTYVYDYKSPSDKTKNFAIRLPNQDLETIKGISATPIQMTSLYSGDYLVKGYTDAEFDLEDGIFAIVRYAINYSFNLTCDDRLCEVVCCFERLQTDLDNCDNSSTKSKSLAQKKEKADNLMMQAIALAQCGKSNAAKVAEIKKLLECECGDCGGSIEGDPALITTGNQYSFSKDCFDVSVIGGVTNISCKSQKDLYKIVPLDNGCGKMITVAATVSGTKTTYAIGVDCDIFKTYVYNLVSTDSDIISAITKNFNFGSQNISIDGKCLITSNQGDYSADICDCNGTYSFQSVLINGTTYAPQGSLQTSNHIAIKSYLNGLGLGTFDVSAVPNSSCPNEKGGCGNLVRITSVGNSNALTDVRYADNNGTIYIAPFSQKVVLKMQDWAQVVTNKICELCFTDIKTCSAYNVCTIDCEKRYSVDADISSNTNIYAYVNGNATPVLITSLDGYRIITTGDPTIIAVGCNVTIDEIKEIDSGTTNITFTQLFDVDGNDKFYIKNVVTVPIGTDLKTVMELLLTNGCSIIDWLLKKTNYIDTDTVDFTYDPATRNLTADVKLQGVVDGIVADDALFDAINKVTTYNDTETVNLTYNPLTDELEADVIVDGVLDEIINNPTLKAKFCSICTSTQQGFQVQVDSNSFEHSYTACDGTCANQFKREVFINGVRLAYVGCTGVDETIDTEGTVFGELYGSMNLNEGQTYSFLFRGTDGDCTPTISCAGVFSVVFYDALNVQVGSTVNVDVSSETPPDDCYLVQNITVPNGAVSVKINIV